MIETVVIPEIATGIMIEDAVIPGIVEGMVIEGIVVVIREVAMIKGIIEEMIAVIPEIEMTDASVVRSQELIIVIKFLVMILNKTC